MLSHLYLPLTYGSVMGYPFVGPSAMDRLGTPGTPPRSSVSPGGWGAKFATRIFGVVLSHQQAKSTVMKETQLRSYVGLSAWYSLIVLLKVALATLKAEVSCLKNHDINRIRSCMNWPIFILISAWISVLLDYTILFFALPYYIANTIVFILLPRSYYQQSSITFNYYSKYYIYWILLP